MNYRKQENTAWEDVMIWIIHIYILYDDIMSSSITPQGCAEEVTVSILHKKDKQLPCIAE